MLAYDEMIQSFQKILACQSLDEVEIIEEEDVFDNQAVYGRPFPKLGRVLHATTKLKRKKEAIEECLKEMCHDGVHIFRVVVHETDDDAQKIFPVQSKNRNGTINTLRYCLKPGVEYQLWLSLLSKGNINVSAHYTAYQKDEIFAGDYIIRQTFPGQEIGSLVFSEDRDEVDVYNFDTIESHVRRTVMTMIFGTQPISVDEIVQPSGLDEIVGKGMEWEERKSEMKDLEFRLKGQMERFLKCRDQKAGDTCWDTDIHARIFGKNWMPNRKQGLEYQKSVVRRVKKGMVCLKEHIFYVSVMQGPPKGEGREHEDTYFQATRRGENEFDFVIPKKVVVLVQIRTLCRFSTPALQLYEVDASGREEPRELDTGKGHLFVLELDQTKTLGATYVNDDNENEVYLVKSENGETVLRINLHNAGWVGPNEGWVGGSKDAVVVDEAGVGRYAAERAALEKIVGVFSRDAVELGVVGEDSLKSDITHLTENFEYIVSELERLRGGGRVGDQNWIQEMERVEGVLYDGGVHAELRNLLKLMQSL
jgi:hypothetical protein